MKTWTHTLWYRGPCFYCGRLTYVTGRLSNAPHRYTRDHLIPKRLRRVSLMDLPAKARHLFTVTCCLGCNQKKGSKRVHEFFTENGFALTAAKRALIQKVYGYNQRRVDATARV